MATHTVVTANPLISVAYSQAPAVLSDADLATVQDLIKDDLNVAHPMMPNYFVREGMLFIPNRGVTGIKLLPGDVVCVTSRGWPILISRDEITSGNSFTFT
jgi:hypothetical protein